MSMNNSNRNMRNRREQKSLGAPLNTSTAQIELQRRQQRQQRFSSSQNKTSYATTHQDRIQEVHSTPNKVNASSAPFVGESNSLEKNFLRLTDFAKKEDVRPIDVLIKSFSHVIDKFKKDRNFEWVNGQLKSIRQDITVQNIRNNFVLDVYETHAKLLIEYGELDEFNRCQTVIRDLTDYGSMDGDTSNKDNVLAKPILLTQSTASSDEFRGYAILYALIRSNWIDLKFEYQRGHKLHMRNSGIGSDTGSCYLFARSVVSALLFNNYHAFFDLYKSAPYKTVYLMNILVERVRNDAYERIVTSYRPSIAVVAIQKWLAYEDIDETQYFLRQHNVVFVESTDDLQLLVDCKASASALHS